MRTIQSDRIDEAIRRFNKDFKFEEITRGSEKKPWIQVLFHDNSKTTVLVFSNADEVELLVNGVSYGRKAVGMKNNYVVEYEVLYQPGIIEAINYRNRMEYSRQVIQTDLGGFL